MTIQLLSATSEGLKITGTNSRSWSPKMIRTILTLGVLAIGVTSVLAENDPIATRKDAMKQISRANAEVTKIS